MESQKSQQTPSEHAHTELLADMPYLQVLTYPKPSLRVAKSRMAQLRRLGVTDLIFEGHTRIGRLGILGIGTVGLVVKARARDEILAIKIRRTDANRPSMENEAKFTAMANRLGIGPLVVDHSKDFMLMKLLEHVEIEDWLRGLGGRGSRDQVRELVHRLLNQCRKLDIMGIDHGQLSNLRKHAVVVEGSPWIIDFESAGTARRPKNVTAAAQYLLVGGRVSPALRRALGVKDVAPILSLLSEYKADQSDFNYSKLLEHLRLA